MQKFLTFLTTVFTLGTVQAGNTIEGIQLSDSRIVFNQGVKSVNYGLTNEYEQPVLASAVVTDFNGKPSSDFAVSPSLYQVQPKTTFQGQIVQINPINSDKENVYWLNIKTVLSDKDREDGASGTLHFAIAQRIKLFYRPKSVTENCRYAAEHLKWLKTEDGLKAINDSKVSVSIVNVEVGDKSQRISDTLLPKSEKTWKLDIDSGRNIKFKYVDEYGNIVELPLLVK